MKVYYLGKTRVNNPEKLLNTVIREENIFDGLLLEECTHNIISKTQIPSGDFINNDFQTAGNLFISIASGQDAFRVSSAQRLMHNTCFWLQ